MSGVGYDDDRGGGFFRWWLAPVREPDRSLRRLRSVRDGVRAWFTPSRTSYEELPQEADEEGRLIHQLYGVLSWIGYFAWLGLQVAGVVAVRSDSGSSDAEERATLFHLYTTGLMLAVATVVGAAVLLAYADRDVRRPTARDLATPVSRAAVWLLAFGLMLLPTAWLGGDESSTLDSIAASVWLIFFFRLLLYVFAIAVALTTCLTYGARHVFRCIDGHPYLAPAVTLTATWLVVVFNSITLGVLAPYTPGTPPVLAVAITVVGPILVTGLAVVELRWARTHLPEALRRGSRPAVEPPPVGI